MVKRIKRHIKTYIILVAIYSAIALLGAVIFHYALPDQYAGFVPAIGIFYLVLGVLLNFMLSHIANNASNRANKLVNAYMLARGAKFFMTLMFMVIGIYCYPEYKMSFAVTLMVFYFAYMILEMYMYYIYDKQMKNGRDKK